MFKNRNVVHTKLLQYFRLLPKLLGKTATVGNTANAAQMAVNFNQLHAF
jgi:hypothetical protein